MANSPTMCQIYVSQVIEPVRQKYPQLYIIHYMDDLLLAAPKEKLLLSAFGGLQTTLGLVGLQLAPEKVQKEFSYHYLGHCLFHNGVLPQKVSLHLDTLQMSNDFQKILGDINWIRPSLKITTGQLKHLFDILQGDLDPNSPRVLTTAGQECIHLIEKP